MSQDQELKIVELQVENFKRISVANIKPDGSTVVIGGNNAQGKSSAIDAIFAALQGKSAVPTDPIHGEAEQGKITLNLDQYIVERTFKEGGKTSLKVKSAEGAVFSSPQDLLNKFSDNLGFDPHEFNRMNPKEQCQAIAAITGIDFDDFAKRRKEVFDKRTDVNRTLKQVTAEYDSMKGDIKSDLPAEKIVLSDLLDELSKASDHNKRSDEIKVDIRALISSVSDINKSIGLLRENLVPYRENAESVSNDIRAQIKALQERLVSVDEGIVTEEEKTSEKVRQGIEAIAKKEAITVARQNELKEFTPIDTEEIKERLSKVEETNSAIDRQLEIQTCKDRLDKGTVMADDLTAEIKQIDIEKENTIAKAEMPMPGLDIEDGCVLLNGHPFEQASSAEQIKACVLIGLAMNPTLRVLIIRDGSLLDENNLALIAQLAEENNAQVWIERVGAGSEVGFVMEDGMVK